jgi:predicted aspartyl protease
MASTRCGFDDTPAVTGYNNLEFHGPTLHVRIGFDPTFDSQAVPIGVPNLPADTIRALVDTGALESCIDSTLAMTLNLPIINRRMVAGAHGAAEVNVHLAQIHVPLLRFTIYGAFCAVDLAAGGQTHLALIGRTFLRGFTMIYEGRTGTVTLHND